MKNRQIVGGRGRYIDDYRLALYAQPWGIISGIIVLMKAYITFISVMASACCWGAVSNNQLRSLYDTRQWFKLRDAVASTGAPPFYRGAVAWAFNQPGAAEKYLRQAIKSAPTSREAIEAHRMLATRYQLTGRYRRALAEFKAIEAVMPDYKGLKHELNEFTLWSWYPEPSVKKRRHSLVPYEIKDDNLFVPVSINGKEAHYLIDTGSNRSGISAGEAKRLGMTVDDAPGLRAHGGTGESSGFQIAIANDLIVGGFHLKHVMFLVGPDDQLAFVDLPPTWRGILGLPELFAFQTIRWNREGILEIGFPSATHGIRGNLCLSGEGPHPVVQGDFEGDRIQMMLDTGAWNTRLLPPFAKDFSQVVQERGSKGFTRPYGAKEFETITLPEVRFRLGGFDGILRPAEILSNFFPFGTSEYHVKLGLGLLQQARQVTIDFHSMNFAME